MTHMSLQLFVCSEKTEKLSVQSRESEHNDQPICEHVRELSSSYNEWVPVDALSLALSESTSQCYVNNVKWISRPPKRLFVWQHAESFSKALNGWPNWCMAMSLQEQQDVAAARAYFSVGHVTPSLYWQLLIPRACFLASCIWPYGLAASHGRMLVSSVGRRYGAREEKTLKKTKKNNINSFFTVVILWSEKSVKIESNILCKYEGIFCIFHRCLKYAMHCFHKLNRSFFFL